MRGFRSAEEQHRTETRGPTINMPQAPVQRVKPWLHSPAVLARVEIYAETYDTFPKCINGYYEMHYDGFTEEARTHEQAVERALTWMHAFGEGTPNEPVIGYGGDDRGRL